MRRYVQGGGSISAIRPRHGPGFTLQRRERQEGLKHISARLAALR
jgi:hypothetical protein